MIAASKSRAARKRDDRTPTTPPEATRIVDMGPESARQTEYIGLAWNCFYFRQKDSNHLSTRALRQCDQPRPTSFYIDTCDQDAEAGLSHTVLFRANYSAVLIVMVLSVAHVCGLAWLEMRARSPHIGSTRCSVLFVSVAMNINVAETSDSAESPMDNGRISKVEYQRYPRSSLQMPTALHPSPDARKGNSAGRR